MNFMVRRLLVLLLFTCGISAFGQQINPTRDINWPKMTGSGAPSSGTCTSSNYGQPYTDTTASNEYWCGSGGWFTITGGTGGGSGISATSGTILKAVTSTTAGDSAVADDGLVVTSTENVQAPQFTGTDTTHNGHVDLASEGAMPSLPGASTIQMTVANSGVVAYRMVLPPTGPPAGNGMLSCAPPVSAVVTCSWVSIPQATGTTFSVSGCSAGSPTGGQSIGKFQSGTSGTCTVTATMGDAQIAPHGWACGSLSDLTTNSDSSSWHQTATTTTTATFSGTTAANDFVQFSCNPY